MLSSRREEMYLLERERMFSPERESQLRTKILELSTLIDRVQIERDDDGTTKTTEYGKFSTELVKFPDMTEEENDAISLVLNRRWKVEILLDRLGQPQTCEDFLAIFYQLFH